MISGPCSIALQPGVHHQQPLTLDERDSDSPYAHGGRAWFSGGVPPTDLQWVRVGSTRVWSADLRGSGIGQMEIASLRVDGSRRSPARWPNADPELEFWPTGYATSTEDYEPKGDWLGLSITPRKPGACRESFVP